MTSNPNAALSGIDWTRIGPDDMQLLLLIGERTRNLAREWIREKRLKDDNRRFIEPDPRNVAMDWGIVHLQTPLDLNAYLNAPADKFLREFVCLQMAIDRVACTVPLAIDWPYRKGFAK